MARDWDAYVERLSPTMPRKGVGSSRRTRVPRVLPPPSPEDVAARRESYRDWNPQQEQAGDQVKLQEINKMLRRQDKQTTLTGKVLQPRVPQGNPWESSDWQKIIDFIDRPGSEATPYGTQEGPVQQRGEIPFGAQTPEAVNQTVAQYGNLMKVRNTRGKEPLDPSNIQTVADDVYNWALSGGMGQSLANYLREVEGSYASKDEKRLKNSTALWNQGHAQWLNEKTPGVAPQAKNFIFGLLAPGRDGFPSKKVVEERIGGFYNDPAKAQSMSAFLSRIPLPVWQRIEEAEKKKSSYYQKQYPAAAKRESMFDIPSTQKDIKTNYLRGRGELANIMHSLQQGKYGHTTGDIARYGSGDPSGDIAAEQQAQPISPALADALIRSAWAAMFDKDIQAGVHDAMASAGALGKMYSRNRMAWQALRGNPVAAAPEGARALPGQGTTNRVQWIDSILNASDKNWEWLDGIMEKQFKEASERSRAAASEFIRNPASVASDATPSQIQRYVSDIREGLRQNATIFAGDQTDISLKNMLNQLDAVTEKYYSAGGDAFVRSRKGLTDEEYQDDLGTNEDQQRAATEARDIFFSNVQQNPEFIRALDTAYKERAFPKNEIGEAELPLKPKQYSKDLQRAAARHMQGRKTSQYYDSIMQKSRQTTLPEFPEFAKLNDIQDHKILENVAREIDDIDKKRYEAMKSILTHSRIGSDGKPIAGPDGQPVQLTDAELEPIVEEYRALNAQMESLGSISPEAMIVQKGIQNGLDQSDALRIARENQIAAGVTPRSEKRRRMTQIGIANRNAQSYMEDFGDYLNAGLYKSMPFDEFRKESYQSRVLPKLESKIAEGYKRMAQKEIDRNLKADPRFETVNMQKTQQISNNLEMQAKNAENMAAQAEAAAQGQMGGPTLWRATSARLEANRLRERASSVKRDLMQLEAERPLGIVPEQYKKFLEDPEGADLQQAALLDNPTPILRHMFLTKYRGEKPAEVQKRLGELYSKEKTSKGGQPSLTVPESEEKSVLELLTTLQHPGGDPDNFFQNPATGMYELGYRDTDGNVVFARSDPQARAKLQKENAPKPSYYNSMDPDGPQDPYVYSPKQYNQLMHEHDISGRLHGYADAPSVRGAWKHALQVDDATLNDILKDWSPNAAFRKFYTNRQRPSAGDVLMRGTNAAPSAWAIDEDLMRSGKGSRFTDLLDVATKAYTPQMPDVMKEKTLGTVAPPQAGAPLRPVETPADVESPLTYEVPTLPDEELEGDLNATKESEGAPADPFGRALPAPTAPAPQVNAAAPAPQQPQTAGPTIGQMEKKPKAAVQSDLGSFEGQDSTGSPGPMPAGKTNVGLQREHKLFRNLKVLRADFADLFVGQGGMQSGGGTNVKVGGVNPIPHGAALQKRFKSKYNETTPRRQQSKALNSTHVDPIGAKGNKPQNLTLNLKRGPHPGQKPGLGGKMVAHAPKTVNNGQMGG